MKNLHEVSILQREGIRHFRTFAWLFLWPHQNVEFLPFFTMYVRLKNWGFYKLWFRNIRIMKNFPTIPKISFNFVKYIPHSNEVSIYSNAWISNECLPTNHGENPQFTKLLLFNIKIFIQTSIKITINWNFFRILIRNYHNNFCPKIVPYFLKILS